MEFVHTSIVVNAPVTSAYALWVNLENLPKFMKAVLEVRKLDEKQYYLRSERGGKEYETVVAVTVQIPGNRVAWRSISGPETSGVVSFGLEPDGSTTIRFEMLYDPNAGYQDAAALAERLRSSLVHFKELIETRTS